MLKNSKFLFIYEKSLEIKKILFLCKNWGKKEIVISLSLCQKSQLLFNNKTIRFCPKTIMGNAVRNLEQIRTYQTYIKLRRNVP